MFIIHFISKIPPTPLSFHFKWINKIKKDVYNLSLGSKRNSFKDDVQIQLISSITLDVPSLFFDYYLVINSHIY